MLLGIICIVKAVGQHQLGQGVLILLALISGVDPLAEAKVALNLLVNIFYALAGGYSW
jgi:hypothetical protein